MSFVLQRGGLAIRLTIGVVRRSPWLLGLCAVLFLLFVGMQLGLSRTVDAEPAIAARLKDLNGLKDRHGSQFNDKQLAGQPTLVFFGLTQCSQICPASLLEMQQLLQRLPQRQRPRVIFVSLDALGDTPESVDRYLRQLGVDALGLSPDMPQLDTLTDAFGISMRMYEGGGIDHSAAWYLFGSSGKLQHWWVPSGNLEERFLQLRHISLGAYS